MSGGTKTPEREPTEPGVGTNQTPEAPAAPIIAVAPTRERTVLGVGAPQPAPKPRAVMPSAPEPPPEDGWDAPSQGQVATKVEGPTLDRSLPIALVPAKSKVQPSTAPSEASLAAAGVPRRRWRRWLAVLFVLVAAGCAAYFMRTRIPWLGPIIERAAAWVAAQRH